MVCSGFKGIRKHEYIEGIEVLRLGGMFSVYFYALVKYLTSKEFRNYHVIIDVMLHGFPFFAKLYSRKPIIALCWHLPRMMYFTELRQRFGLFVGIFLFGACLLLEDKIAPLVYRSVPMFTFSKSSEKDLIQTGYKKVYMRDKALARAIIFNSISHEEIRDRALTLRPLTIENDCPLILYLGRLTKYKGVQDAVKAMTVVSKHIPHAKLYVVGRGQYEPELKKLVNHLRLEGSVVFPGYLSFKEKVEMLQRAQVLVMPSYREGFPTPIFEARMCGIPTVASDAYGVGEYVKHGFDGFVFPTADWMRMAEFLILILRHEKLRETLKKNSMAWARTFNLEKVENEILDLLEKIISEEVLRKVGQV